MNLQNLVKRFVLLFSFVLGLGWGTHGVMFPNTEIGESWKEIKIGSWGWHRCNTTNNCPGLCVVGSSKGVRYNSTTKLWEFKDFVPGISGCTQTGTYKICGGFWCPTNCSNGNDKCGVKDIAFDIIDQTSGASAQWCSSTNAIPCGRKGCD
jgi:hypothetical protein